jgi:flagellar basal-body rod modification protein FlgD
LTASSTQTTTKTANPAINQTDFLKLLLTQVQNQDPLQPMTNAEFASQLAQFSTLQGINSLDTEMQTLLQLDELTQGAGLVGKKVIYQPAGTNTSANGVVSSVSVQNGQLQLSINGQNITLNQVQGVTS